MKVQIVTPFKMQWVSGFKKYFETLGWEVDVYDKPQIRPKPDIQLLMWLNEDTVNYVNSGYQNGTKVIVFIRRYEYYTDAIEKTEWKNVDAVVMVNEFLARGFEYRTKIKPYVIWNGVDVDQWKYKKRKHGHNIAMVGYINQRKNFSLALQILMKLPKEYELHVAGDFQDGASVDYISNLAFSKNLTDRIFMYNHIDDIDLWLEDKNYLLCTAISEGCPNNVIEAMAKGIKPVIHNWPGSNSLFKDYTFDTIDEAVAMMLHESPYKSRSYQVMTEALFGENIYNNLSQLIQEIAGQKTKTFHDIDWNVTLRKELPDIYVVSYPKAGRTWLRIFFQMAIAKIMDENFSIEHNRIYPIKSMHPSIEFTHSHINWNPSKKTIFLIRDFRDILVSSYFHCQRRSKTIPMDMSLSEFIRSPEGGIDLVINWHRAWCSLLKNTDYRVLLYSGLHLNPKREFKQILEYIGIDTENNLSDLDICIQASSFDEVRKNLENGKMAILHNNATAELSRYYPTDEKDPESHKLRRGIVGGYKDYLSKEDIQFINDKQ